jgi:ATP adenylyltransferase
METLWAPWRLGYIVGEDKPPELVSTAALLPGAEQGCFLCQCAPEGDDRPRLVVARDERTITILNRYPYNNGHLLVAPRRHLGRLDELSADEQLALSQAVTRMVAVLEKVLRPEGFNVGLNLGRVAGAGLPGHLHWHVVPRWPGDTNFMPVLAGVRIIPQSLEALGELVRAEMARHD